MSNALDAVSGAQDTGINWSGKFLVRVNGQRLIGFGNVKVTLTTNESDIPDAGKTMPIGKSLDSRAVTWSIAMKTLSGGSATDPQSALPGNFELFKSALENAQFDLEVIEKNLKQGRTDWIYRSVLLRGCTQRGALDLVDISERAGGPPGVNFAGNALVAIVQFGNNRYVYTGLS